MAFSVFLDNRSAPFVEDIGELSHNTIRGIRQGWFRAGDQLKSRANEQIKARPKNGRLYRIKGRRHRASAPGESPANRTGTYRRSINYQIRGWRQMEFGASADYAGFLERGTRRMEPRPGLQNAIDVEQNHIVSILENEIRKAIT